MKNSFYLILLFLFLTFSTLVFADSFSVSGSVSSINDKPVNGVTVKAFGRNMRGERQLGSGVTDSNGYYSINYETDPGHTLVVRVYYQSGGLLASSEPVYNVNEDQTVDIFTPLLKLKEKSKSDIIKKIKRAF